MSVLWKGTAANSVNTGEGGAGSGYTQSSLFSFEPQHNKTNNMAGARSEDAYQPGHLSSLISLRVANDPM